MLARPPRSPRGSIPKQGLLLVFDTCQLIKFLSGTFRQRVLTLRGEPGRGLVKDHSALIKQKTNKRNIIIIIREQGSSTRVIMSVVV